jgi:hypothetical protein
VKSRYILGSSKTTNAIAQQQKLIKPGQRLFNLDGEKQRDQAHQLYDFCVTSLGPLLGCVAAQTCDIEP